MKIKYLDGQRLRNAIIAGSKIVFQMREHLNKINLFPIPDKDTGTNLTVTLRNVVELLHQSQSKSVAHTSQLVAEGALLAAQGNSGAILAQFFQGFAEGLKGKMKISTDAFSQAVEIANQKVSEAIATPVEGTIISVINDWTLAVRQSCKKSQDFVIVLRNALAEARHSLAKTKEKIEILRRANVVDAGAQGFVTLLEGISQFIEEGTVKEVLSHGLSELHSLPEFVIDDFQAPISLRYCVECLMLTRESNKTAIQELLGPHGESLTIAHSKRLMKIHIHTNEPETIKSILSEWGEIQSTRVIDLVKQQQETVAAQRTAQIALVTDSSCDLPHDLLMKYQVHVVPVRIHFGDETYIDKQTITPLEFYEKLKTSKVHPTTSQPTPANFKQVYENLARHFQTIISIHLAARLSGTFQAAQTAAAFIKDANIVLIDSKTTSIALGLLLLEAGEAIQKGLQVEKVVEKVETIRKKLHLIIHLPTLKYLIKGGRVSKGKGLIATLLNIKPLLTFDETGAISELGKAFGKKGAFKKIIRIVKSGSEQLRNIRIGIVHANAIGKAELLVRKFSEIPHIKSITVHDVAPVLGVHSGPGTLGVAFWGEELNP